MSRALNQISSIKGQVLADLVAEFAKTPIEEKVKK